MKARQGLKLVGKLLKSHKYSKHSAVGLKRRQRTRTERRKLLSKTFTRTLIARLLNVTGNADLSRG